MKPNTQWLWTNRSSVRNVKNEDIMILFIKILSIAKCSNLIMSLK